MPTVPRMGNLRVDAVYGSHDMSRFDDAEDGAMPLERPHAPNCFDARKLMRKQSSEDRYADLSSSNDGERTPHRLSSTDSDAHMGTSSAVASPKADEYHERESLLERSDHLGSEDVAITTTTGDIGTRGIFSKWFMFTREKDQSPRDSDDRNDIKLNECDPFSSSGRGIDVDREKKSKNVSIFSGANSLCMEACYMVLFVISTVCRSLRSILVFPFRYKKDRNITVPARFEMNAVENKSASTGTTALKVNTAADGSTGTGDLSSSRRVKSDDLVVERKVSSQVSGTGGSSKAYDGDLENSLAHVRYADVHTALVRGAVTEKQHVAKKDGNATAFERMGETSCGLPSSAIRTSSSETTNTEGSDEYLWQRIQQSDQWIKDDEQPVRRKTFASQERLSPVSQENIMKTLPPSSNNVLKSTERNDVLSKTQESAIQHVQGAASLPNQQYQKRNSSFEDNRSLEHSHDPYYDERGFTSSIKKRDSLTSQEPDLPRISGPGRFRKELFETEEDEYQSPYSLQFDRLYLPEIRRKYPFRKAVMSEVKAMTDSLFRVFAKNKPEPDTRFTSPRSAHKTMTLIADLMIREFNCQVAVRRNGDLKLRCEKHYSLNRMLRARVTFQELDIFSCNVVIARSRADNFTVPTADYVNFVAGLQKALLDNITGSERYQ